MSGGSKQTQTQQQTQTVGPWSPAQPTLQAILGQANASLGNIGPNATENAALGGLASNAQTAGGYAPQLQGITDSLFAGGGYGSGVPGIQAGYQTASNALTPLATADLDPMNNPATAGLLSSLSGQVRNDVGSRFAAAGRSFSGAHAGALGKGITEASLPVLFNQYNQNVQDRMNAANSLSSLGINTSGALDAAAGNQINARMAAPGSLANLNIPQQMTLDAEQARRNLPLSNLSNIENLVLPIAQLGREGTTSGTTTAQQASNPWQTALGAALGGLGILGSGGAFGSGGLLSGAFGGGSSPWLTTVLPGQ